MRIATKQKKMKQSRAKQRALWLALISLVLVFFGLSFQRDEFSSRIFDGQRAFRDLEYQFSLGPRVPGSEAHAAQVEWMRVNLENLGWNVVIQEAAPLGENIYNLVAKRGEGDPLILIAAHYDTRAIADADPTPENQHLPIPGANDGASGVAVLMELARVLPGEMHNEIWLVFFDAEDGLNVPGWGLSLGSRAFVAQLDRQPEAVVVVDMIGDTDLSLPRDGLSNEELLSEIWAVAADLGYDDVFRNEIAYHMLDDHTAFNEQGIPAALIIDFDYPYWHTLEDDIDKVSADSLQIVGDTLLAWLLSK